MAIYSYPKKVRLGNGQVYQLADSGWYRPTADATGDIVDAPSFSELFQKQAQATYDPLYQPLEQQMTSSYDSMKKNQLESLKGEYSRRGILSSGLYGEKYADTSKQADLNKASALNSLMMEKLGKISGDVSTQMDTQRKGEQTDYERRMAEEQAAREAQAAAEERAYQIRMREMALENERISQQAAQQAAQVKVTQAKTKSSGGSSKSSSGTKKITAGQLTTAQKILAEEDFGAWQKAQGKTADKMLSKNEAERARQRIIALVGGNEDLGNQLFKQAWGAGGFKKWGSY